VKTPAQSEKYYALKLVFKNLLLFVFHRQVGIWHGESDESQIVERVEDAQSEDVWEVEDLESELSRTNFWCPASEEPPFPSSGIADPPYVCLIFCLRNKLKPSCLRPTLTSGKLNGFQFGLFFNILLALIFLAMLWFMIGCPEDEFYMQVGKFFYLRVGPSRRYGEVTDMAHLL
jgi:hypothetical protein